jgi:hypothetical protein
MGREDIWGVGLSMSEWFDTKIEFLQFMTANEADHVTRDAWSSTTRRSGRSL